RKEPSVGTALKDNSRNRRRRSAKSPATTAGRWCRRSERPRLRTRRGLQRDESGTTRAVIYALIIDSTAPHDGTAATATRPNRRTTDIHSKPERAFVVRIHAEAVRSEEHTSE